MITVENITKRYETVVAVDNLSFEINTGESFGLLGPNGAGKSTTIGILSGLIEPDAGSVTVEGQNAISARHLIGNTPQTIALYDELSADENLRFFGRLYGLSGSVLSERVDAAIEIAGLKERRKDRVDTYSGGMKRRLNLAAALVHNPTILLLDEPTVGVDPQSRNLIFEKIEQLKESGRTIIYTTHYMAEAQRLCDRVAIIDAGKILDIDSVENLISSHGGKSVVIIKLEEIPPDEVELPAALDQLNLRFESEKPLEDVGRLSSAGVKFRSLRVDRPDLESVFLNLTGRSLRDR